eukprot:3628143-Rhodomonas_salina.8
MLPIRCAVLHYLLPYQPRCLPTNPATSLQDLPTSYELRCTSDAHGLVLTVHTRRRPVGGFVRRVSARQARAAAASHAL